MSTETRPCPICGSPTESAGEKHGSYVDRTFTLRHCPTCRFSFVADPVEDYESLYDAAYYEGHGADPLVDYLGEMEDPAATIRVHEWQGILDVVRDLTPIGPTTRWLDFGGGNGGLVRHVERETGAYAVVHETGWITERYDEWQIPSVDADELAQAAGTFDVVTAVEMLEHVPDPLPVLRQMRAALRPGGLLLLTTGNAAPYRGRLASWPYVLPELHVSFYEPGTLAYALDQTGFTPQFAGYRSGWTEIIRFKILKNLGRKTRSPLETLVPWPLASRAADRRYGLSAHPVGWAREPAGD